MNMYVYINMSVLMTVEKKKTQTNGHLDFFFYGQVIAVYCLCVWLCCCEC